MLFDLKNLASAKSKVQKKRVISSGNAYEDAVAVLREFEKEPDNEKLRDASDKLLASLQFNSNHGQSYVCLAYIFFILNDHAFAYKYIQKAESLLPYLPEKTKKLKMDIIASLPYKVK